MQTDLGQKRETIRRLSERLEEIGRMQNNNWEEDDENEDEDILGETLNGFTVATDTASSSAPSPIQHHDNRQLPGNSSTNDTTSNVRNRHSATTFSPEAKTTSSSTSPPGAAPTTRSDTLLTHHSAQQEDITSNLLTLSRALKESQLRFAASLESEKGLLSSATEGLDKNAMGMEAASKRMGTLRRMSEGKGWWGRIMLYAWIFGLMVLAVLIVFVGPKLRF